MIKRISPLLRCTAVLAVALPASAGALAVPATIRCASPSGAEWTVTMTSSNEATYTGADGAAAKVRARASTRKIGAEDAKNGGYPGPYSISTVEFSRGDRLYEVRSHPEGGWKYSMRLRSMPEEIEGGSCAPIGERG